MITCFVHPSSSPPLVAFLPAFLPSMESERSDLSLIPPPSPDKSREIAAFIPSIALAHARQAGLPAMPIALKSKFNAISHCIILY